MKMFHKQDMHLTSSDELCFYTQWEDSDWWRKQFLWAPAYDTVYVIS